MPPDPANVEKVSVTVPVGAGRVPDVGKLTATASDWFDLIVLDAGVTVMAVVAHAMEKMVTGDWADAV